MRNKVVKKMLFRKLLSLFILLFFTAGAVVVYLTAVAVDGSKTISDAENKAEIKSSMLAAAEKDLHMSSVSDTASIYDMSRAYESGFSVENQREDKPFSPELLHPLPLLQNAPKDGYFDYASGINFTREMISGVIPYDFGQFYIGRMDLADYHAAWMNKLKSEGNYNPARCKVFAEKNRIVVTGSKCTQKYSYIEAHSGADGKLAAVLVNGDKKVIGHSIKQVNEYLAKRYHRLLPEEMSPVLREIEGLQKDLCQSMIALMDGKYKCSMSWYTYRNFVLIFSTSTYDDKDREQFLYATPQHLMDHERMTLKRRLAIIRQEISRRNQERKNN